VPGKVVLEQDANIWFGSVLRGDNEPIVIGARSNVQDNCLLHTDAGFPLTVGADCTVGHMSVLHGCTVGRGCLIGIGAAVLNGASIGEECLIGAHALVPEGKHIPARSVAVGAPARVVRQVTEKDLKMIRDGVALYVERGRLYAHALTRQA
jgi:carbonic anhydrase/acetyltransferase-like protein (isoleucine patch superfamily)